MSSYFHLRRARNPRKTLREFMNILNFELVELDPIIKVWLKSTMDESCSLSCNRLDIVVELIFEINEREIIFMIFTFYPKFNMTNPNWWTRDISCVKSLKIDILEINNSPFSTQHIFHSHKGRSFFKRTISFFPFYPIWELLKRLQFNVIK